MDEETAERETTLGMMAHPDEGLAHAVNVSTSRDHAQLSVRLSSFPLSSSSPQWQRKMQQRDFEGRSRVSVLAFIVTSPHSPAENNLFLVKRLIQRTDMRNPDPGAKRYTSLAWAATFGHEETFEFLLTAGHDDEELSRVCILRTVHASPPGSRPDN